MKFKDIHILIIDDDFASDDPLVIKLKEIYKNVIVRQPKDALLFIEENLSQQMIILLDVNMPHHLDGHQVLEKIRQKTFLIPVIIFTAIQEEEETFADFINNKAAGFISKDASSKDIIKMVNKVALESQSQIDNALEDWIEKQPDEIKTKPYLSSNGKSYSLNELLKEIRLQTELGKRMSGDITKLTIDLLSRNKNNK